MSPFLGCTSSSVWGIREYVLIQLAKIRQRGGTSIRGSRTHTALRGIHVDTTAPAISTTAESCTVRPPTLLPDMHPTQLSTQARRNTCTDLSMPALSVLVPKGKQPNAGLQEEGSTVVYSHHGTQENNERNNPEPHKTTWSNLANITRSEKQPGTKGYTHCDSMY